MILDRKADAKASSLLSLGCFLPYFRENCSTRAKRSEGIPFLALSLSLLSAPLVGWWDDGKWKREETVSRFEADPARPDYSAQWSGTLDGTDSVPITQHFPLAPLLEMGGSPAELFSIEELELSTQWHAGLGFSSVVNKSQMICDRRFYNSGVNLGQF